MKPVDADRIAVRVVDMPHRGMVTVARSNVYACPEGVLADAKAVPIDAFPKTPDGPFRVKVTRASRPVLARAHRAPKPGERVLLCLLSYDLLALFVATVEPEGAS